MKGLEGSGSDLFGGTLLVFFRRDWGNLWEAWAAVLSIPV